ncbi:MAG: hypothetical protein WCO94_09560 [Verrucomicrobiota bacterium]
MNYHIDQQLLRLKNEFVEQEGHRERTTRACIAHPSREQGRS